MIKTSFILFLFLSFICLAASAQEPAGVEQLTSFERFPYFKPNVQVRYSGSIDRTGRNADWDWCLYQDKDEYVLMETQGPGCIVNLLTYYNHLNTLAGKGKFKFYFDGASVAQYELAVDSIGYQYPFVAPLAHDWNFIAKGACRVRRSFVPMPFTQSCKVTFTERLDVSNGGWGHIIYHTYTQAPPNLKTFTGKEDFSKALNLWKKTGEDPKPSKDNRIEAGKILRLASNESRTLFAHYKAGTIAAIKIKPKYAASELLQNLWIKIYWDEQKEPAVNCPIGAFFGNELRQADIKMLSHGMTAGDFFYNYFPMPFWSAAKIVIENKSNTLLTELAYEIHHQPASATHYPKEKCGYFYAAYTPRQQSVLHQPFQVGSIKGRGHLVGGQITAYSCSDRHPEEGDVQIFIDGNKTPQIESDGSESWPVYGWGFPVGPQSNAASAYDGQVIPWTMTKVNLSDWYPFNTSLDFRIEHGDVNVNTMEHSGAMFFYLQPEPAMLLTDQIDPNNAQSVKDHNYSVKGGVYFGTALKDKQHKMMRLNGYFEADYLGLDTYKTEYSVSGQFEAAILPDNQGVKIRRQSDQSNARQRARVYIDNVLVKERDWYYADYNSSKILLEDEFEVPLTYTKGKHKIAIRIEFVSSEKGTWNEIGYQVFSYKN